MEPGLDEAVRVPVVRGVELRTGQVPLHVLHENLAFEMGDRPRLRNRQVRCVTDYEDIGLGTRLKRALLGGHEVELVTEAGRAAHPPGAAVKWDHDRQVERHLAFVEANEPATRTVDFAGIELRYELDTLLLEHVA